MLVAIRITGDSKSSLDNALTSTLLPQLENLPLSSLGVLDVFYNNKNNQKDENIVKYLKAAYKNPSRQSFVESFDKVLRYLEIDNYETIIEEFSNGVLNINNNTLWTTIEIAFENKKKNINSDLVLFNSGINDLRKSAVV